MLVLISCEEKKELEIFKTYDESELIQKQQEHQIPRMKFKLLQSKVLNMNTIFKPFNDELATNFSEEEYNNLKPLILEQNIPSIQESISKGILSYEKLTLFYLYRIRKLESDSSTTLLAIIALNSTVLEEARARDNNRDTTNFLINVSMYGMPVLIKDNINAADVVNYWNKNKKVRFEKGYYNNCVGCFHRSPTFLNKMAQEHPNKMNWFADMEEKNKPNTFRKDVKYSDVIKWKPQIELDFDDFTDCDSGYCGL